MESSSASINTIPNEILLTILSLLPTKTLIPITTTSHRFLSIILRILRQRLLRAASLPDHRLILECYHPSAKLSTPYLYCDYLYTDGLDDNPTATSTESTLTLSTLSRSYAHFRPIKQDENRRGRRRYPPSVSSPPQTAHDTLPDPPSQDVYLESGELFTQLCTVTNLVKLGPKPGLFLSHVNVNDGLIRVWRDWLAAQADNLGSTGPKEAPILWADRAQTVGVRFRVFREMAGAVMVMADEGDEVNVEYRLVFEELVVRAGRLLLLAVEKSERQEVTTSGKAVVIASF